MRIKHVGNKQKAGRADAEPRPRASRNPQRRPSSARSFLNLSEWEPLGSQPAAKILNAKHRRTLGLRTKLFPLVCKTLVESPLIEAVNALRVLMAFFPAAGIWRCDGDGMQEIACQFPKSHYQAATCSRPFTSSESPSRLGRKSKRRQVPTMVLSA